MTGDTPETLPVPQTPDEGTHTGADDVSADEVRSGQQHLEDVADAGAPGISVPDTSVPDHRLDASAHAHLLEEPLPPEAATETAVIYNVAVARPHQRDAVPVAVPVAAVRRASAVAHGPDATAVPEVGAHPAAATQRESTGAAAPAQDAVPRPGAVRRSDTAAGAGAVRVAPRPPAARRAGAAAAVVLVGVLACLAGYLWISATEWRDNAGAYQRAASDLGDDLAASRNQLAGSQAELEAVRAQLSTAHARIVELADEKNQALDDWEITQQLVDYQQRVSEAAGGVALALDRCVQGQQELIGYLEQQVQPAPSAPPYDPEQLAEFETQVEALCQEASEANIGLQLELAR